MIDVGLGATCTGLRRNWRIIQEIPRMARISIYVLSRPSRIGKRERHGASCDKIWRGSWKAEAAMDAAPAAKRERRGSRGG
jgi:hypothetical protein